MGRRGGRWASPTLSPAVIHERVTRCRIGHLPFDDIADHLYSAFADYKHYKLIPFRIKIRQILQQQQQCRNAVEEDRALKKRKPIIDDNENGDEVDGREQKLVRRKKQKPSSDDREQKSVSETSFSISSEADFEPEFDVMKSMLRAGYKDIQSNAKSESKLVNLEMEITNKEMKNVANSSQLWKSEEEELGFKRGLSLSQGCSSGGTGPRFCDFGGIKKELEELEWEVIQPLRNPKLLQWLNVKPISGILLYGPPGCGKTRLAQAIANETALPFYSISAPELVSGVSGGSEEKIRELFTKAYENAPSIVFIDEFDAIGSKRENSQREMERRIVTQLLTCMDEFHGLAKRNGEPAKSEHAERLGYVLVIGATNRPDAIDPALRRPGRFDKEILLPVPDESARAEILSLLTKDSRLECEFDVTKIAKATPGFVGADLAHLVNKAGILALKRFIDQRRLELSDEGCKDVEHQRDESCEDLEQLRISMVDFETAAKMVQPSLRREGFSTIPKVTWEDVGGLNELRKEFERHIVDRIKFPELYEKVGVESETGYLLFGPPGCGKTLIAMAVAHEAGANFIHIKGPELLNKYVGESESHVRALFRRARTCSPCILFFDEVDALTTERGKEGGWVVERLLNQLLIELDGGEHRRGVYVIGATNRPEVVDRALLRPGRFGKPLYVPLPKADERGLILKALARRKPIDVSVNLLDLGQSEICENLSGADLAELMEQAAMALRDEIQPAFEAEQKSRQSIFAATAFTIKQAHFELARSRVSPSVSEEQKQHYDEMSKSFSEN
ncbi:Cell division control protein 48-like protein C [Bienertia sinuspersici]